MKQPLLLALASLTLCFSTAQAASVKVTGTLRNGAGYTVYLLQKNGASKSVTLPASGKFTFSRLSRANLSGASLQIVDSTGAVVGPVVLDPRKRTKVSTTFSGTLRNRQTSIALGRLTLSANSATVTRAVAASLTTNIARAPVAAVGGVPVGAGEMGLVSTVAGRRLNAQQASAAGRVKIAAEPGVDTDLDGIPNGFDADDDGDLILDASDTDSAGADIPYSTMDLDFRRTLNSNVRSGLTDELIDAVIGGQNVFNLISFISLPTNLSSTVTGGHVICNSAQSYCRPNTPLAFYSGVSESSSDFRNKPWSELLTADGFPRMELASIGGNATLLSAIQPRVARSAFRPGDVYRVALTGASGELSSRTFTIAPYFVSVPALQSYNTGAGAVTVDYSALSAESGSIPGVSSSAPIVLSSDGTLTMTFWRPQRAAIRSDESGFYDWGQLNYGVGVGDAQATCAGLYSAVSSDLVVDPTPFGDGDSIFFSAGANGTPYRDSQNDRAASASNTLSFTVNLKQCLTRAGQGGTGTFQVTLTAAGESVTGGQSSARQSFYVQIP